MKSNFYRKTRFRSSNVLAFFSNPGSPLRAVYHGPYSVVKRVNKINSIISTSDRRKYTQLIHKKIAKPYNCCDLASDSLMQPCCTLVVSPFNPVSIEGNKNYYFCSGSWRWKETSNSQACFNLSDSLITGKIDISFGTENEHK